MPLTPDAELLLLILAAADGQMTRDEAEREFVRVRTLSPAARARWQQIAIDLARRGWLPPGRMSHAD